MFTCWALPTGILIVSIMTGLVLDVNNWVRAPSFYWSLGSLSGFISGILTAICLSGG